MSENRLTTHVSDEGAFRQQQIIDELRKINDEEFARTGRRKKHLTVTYGCQMNSVGCIFISH